MDKSVSSVLDFWFNPNEPIQNRSKIWFTADPEFDEDIRKRFGQLVSKKSGILMVRASICLASCQY